MKIFDYDDILLIPNKCVVKSRIECNTKITLGKFTFKLPVVPSNMKSVINEELCIKLAKKQYFYIMHRFEVENFKFVVNMHKKNLYSSISIGVKQKDYELIEKFQKHNVYPNFITIDIAHGHSLVMKKMIKFIKSKLGNESFIIAGNVATPDAVRELELWGADTIKVGVGPGKVCTTKIQTGFGTGGWQLSALAWCSKAASVPIIADGGLRVNGDIAKSIRFGAIFCMIGAMFAAHIESPGKEITVDKTIYKEYYGSASEFNKKEKRYLEGTKDIIKLRGSIFETLEKMEQNLQSSISYAGGNTLSVLSKVDYVILKHVY